MPSAALADFALPGAVVLLRGPGRDRMPGAERRRHEHAHGRVAARAALTRLGGAALGDAPLDADADGLVVWPVGTVGSISHCAPWAVAAVSHSAAGVGIDVEAVVPSREVLWDRVVMPEDAAGAPPHASRAFVATVCFSLREAFYKCVYPTLRQPMDWPDARFDIDWGSGDVAVRVDPRFEVAGTVTAQFREVGGAVVSGCWWERD